MTEKFRLGVGGGIHERDGRLEVKQQTVNKATKIMILLAIGKNKFYPRWRWWFRFSV